jgi:DNA helicase HerA-like ATPase
MSKQIPTDGKKMINFYTLPKMQKYLKKSEDEQLMYTNCKIYKHMLICAPTGGGKSNCIANYIMLSSEQKKGMFDHIFFCYETDEELYLFLKENIDKKKITFIRGIGNFPDVNVFPDQVTNDEERIFLIIFDDCINEKNKILLKKIEDYFKLGRKRGITLCFLTQRYYDTSKFVRAQVSYVFLAGLSGRDASAVLKDCGLSDISKAQLTKIFKLATRKEDDTDLPFLKIYKMVCPTDQKFSRNSLTF